MILVVIDTNIFISGFLNPKGKPYAIVDLILEEKLILLLSPQIMDEIKRVCHYEHIIKLIEKGGKTVKDVEQYIDKIRQIALIMLGNLQVNAIENDPSDNMFLACALEGKADYIVSGDSHLLDLKSFQGIKIVPPDEFLKIVKNG